MGFRINPKGVDGNLVFFSCFWWCNLSGQSVSLAAKPYPAGSLKRKSTRYRGCYLRENLAILAEGPEPTGTALVLIF